MCKSHYTIHYSADIPWAAGNTDCFTNEANVSFFFLQELKLEIGFIKIVTKSTYWNVVLQNL
jgi:hypothetical protein